MQGSKIPFCCLKFPWERGRYFPKITDNLGMRSQKRFFDPDLGYNFGLTTDKFWRLSSRNNTGPLS
jgi:hypothetical protein